jgi:Glu-tRNA(Gln) amidotransferase subunit E-like FAD-binding protein
MKSLERKGVSIQNLDETRMEELFNLVDKGVTAKESLEQILEELAQDRSLSPMETIKQLGLEMFTQEELKIKLQHLVDSNRTLFDKFGDKATNKLIGLAMQELRGRVEPQQMINLLTNIIKERKISEE